MCLLLLQYRISILLWFSWNPAKNGTTNSNIIPIWFDITTTMPPNFHSKQTTLRNIFGSLLSLWLPQISSTWLDIFFFFHPFCIILSYLLFSFFSTTLPYEFVETVRNERKYVGSFAEKGRRLRRDVSLSAALRGECRNLGEKGSNNRLKVTYRASIGLISR